LWWRFRAEADPPNAELEEWQLSWCDPGAEESEAQASGSGGACGFFCRDKEDPAAESLNPKSA
jgi:hypothetical protein